MGLKRLGEVEYRESIEEMKHADKLVERGSQASLKDGIAACEAARDYVSREILREILGDTEEHIDWIETQLGLIGKVGTQNYLQSQMETGSPS
jgi:bacterioferritin